MLRTFSKYPLAIHHLAEPLGRFRDEFLTRARERLLRPTESFWLKGLDSYWRRQGEPRSAEGFQRNVWTSIDRWVRALPATTTAEAVLDALMDRSVQATHAGPAWLEVDSFNELLWQAREVLEALAEEYRASALAATPEHALASPAAAVRHELTGSYGVVLAATSFDRTGFQYTVMPEGRFAPESWPAAAAHQLH